VYPVIVRTNLVEALSSMSRLGVRESARDFLEGLSTDELQYIAGYLGARTIDPELNDSVGTRGCRARAIERYERTRIAQHKCEWSSGGRTAVRQAADVSHKMIVLLEFLARSERTSVSTHAWSAAGGSA
jgi:hypothetical protein